MSDYALVQSVFVEPKGSTLFADASVSDTVLYVDDAQDFDDEGGFLSLNGAKLQYTSLVEGDNPDDPDEINLAEPLAVAADEDDIVAPLAGGLVGEDWYAVATMGEDGDVVHIPIDVDQRNQWPVGEYPDPVPVIVSDDLQRLEDAPGRTVSSRNAFRNTDEYTYDGIAASIELPLTKTPITGSEQPFWKAATVAVGGVGLPPGSWRIEMPYLIVDDVDLMAEFEEDDLFWVHYAYDAAADDISRPDEPEPLLIGAVADFNDITPTAGLGPNVSNDIQFFCITDQPSETVTASGAGTITHARLMRNIADAGASVKLHWFTVGTISGDNYTITAITGVLTDSDPASLIDDFDVSLTVNPGEYLGVICDDTGGTINQTLSYVNMTGAEYRQHTTGGDATSGTPMVGDVIALDAGVVSDRLLLIQGSDE